MSIVTTKYTEEAFLHALPKGPKTRTWQKKTGAHVGHESDTARHASDKKKMCPLTFFDSQWGHGRDIALTRKMSDAIPNSSASIGTHVAKSNTVEIENDQAPLWKPVPLPSGVGSSSASPSISYGLDPKKMKGVSGAIEKAFKIGAREQLDGEIARMFYTGGLSFHFARNPHYLNSFKVLVPIQFRVISLSDGRSDSQRRPLINILAVCEIGPMFLQAVNCEGVVKDKHFIASFLTDSIREIGPQNVVQVITDNAANCDFGGSDSVNDRGCLSPEIWRTPTYNEGVSQLWDVGGDVYDSMEM
ncbi:hypothetical protein Ddye_009165 [Dipteronia dyeriana]|uniref:DUF659 domain-containing protein n=1 Tax=Dipteronia dyeriana TaxID=168575 RepID=A0AAE0CMM4_9ROSI|nr:hypothetical protein Ddye_009165 [Dipteronia dyeriana]